MPALFAVEAHPGLHHLVSTVPGRLRADVGLADARARDVPARLGHRRAEAHASCRRSKTSSPCAAASTAARSAGSTATAARAELAVAIRTFTIADGRTHLGVGGGIVADSQPDAEWAETELKAARLLAAAGATPSRDGGRSGMTVWVERRALDADSRPRLAARPRPARRRRRVRDPPRLRRRAVRVDPPPRPACTRRPPGSDSPLPDADELRAAADAVLRANGLTEARLRITVTGGPAPPGRARRRCRRP